jgi:hypothetical protein
MAVLNERLTLPARRARLLTAADAKPARTKPKRARDESFLPDNPGLAEPIWPEEEVTGAPRKRT